MSVLYMVVAIIFGLVGSGFALVDMIYAVRVMVKSLPAPSAAQSQNRRIKFSIPALSCLLVANVMMHTAAWVIVLLAFILAVETVAFVMNRKVDDEST